MFEMIRESKDGLTTAAIHHDGVGYVVTIWEADTDRFLAVDRFDHDGPSFTPKGKAALAMAKGCRDSIIAMAIGIDLTI